MPPPMTDDTYTHTHSLIALRLSAGVDLALLSSSLVRAVAKQIIHKKIAKVKYMLVYTPIVYKMDKH